MTSAHEGGQPLVELTIRVQYPQSPLDPEYAALGIHTHEQLLEHEIEEMRLDPTFLVELIESDESEVTFDAAVDGVGPIDITPPVEDDLGVIS